MTTSEPRSDCTASPSQHEAPKAEPTKKHIFDLPRELRDEIYRQAFIGHNTTAAYRYHSRLAILLIQLHPIRHALLVNHQFAAEAKEIFYNENIFNVEVCCYVELARMICPCKPDLTNQPLNKEAQQREKRSHKTKRPDVRLIRNLEVSLMYMSQGICKHTGWLFGHDHHCPILSLSLALLRTFKLRYYTFPFGHEADCLTHGRSSTSDLTFCQSIVDDGSVPYCKRPASFQHLLPKGASFDMEVWTGHGLDSTQAIKSWREGWTLRQISHRLGRPLVFGRLLCHAVIVDKGDTSNSVPTSNGSANDTFDIAAQVLHPTAVTPYLAIINRNDIWAEWPDPGMAYNDARLKARKEFERHIGLPNEISLPREGMAFEKECLLWRLTVSIAEAWGTNLLYSGPFLANTGTLSQSKSTSPDPKQSGAQ